MSNERRNWRALGPRLALIVVFFAAMSALFFWGPLASRYDDYRVPLGVGFAVAGVFAVFVVLFFTRPGYKGFEKYRQLERDLSVIVGTPTVFFAAVPTTASVNDPTLTDAKDVLHWSGVALCAVGPSGVALGSAGKQSRVVSIANASDEVRFSVGGPGGFPLKLRSETTPQLQIEVIRSTGSFVVHFDHLTSMARPGEVRDEREVRELVQELATAGQSTS
jgi:hypothetical protein